MSRLLLRRNWIETTDIVPTRDWVQALLSAPRRVLSKQMVYQTVQPGISYGDLE